MDRDSEEYLRSQIDEIRAVPIAQQSEHHLMRLNALETELRRRQDKFESNETFSIDSIAEQLRSKRKYVLNVNDQQKHLQLADFGRMVNQLEANFGKVLFGVDGIQEDIAKAALDRHRYFQDGVTLKEYYKVPALLCGMGTGKSTMLDRHLTILRAFCNNDDLKKLLESHPLVLNVTFNSHMTYTEQESAESIRVCLARRMVASYFAIRWDTASTLKLSNKPDVVIRTLELLVDHHKKQHGLEDTDQIAVFLNVDEINAIPQELGYDVDGRDKAAGIVGKLMKELRGLSMTGVSNRCPVIPLVAGTAQLQVIAAARGSGVQLVVKNLPVLSDIDMYKALRDCGVDEQYLRNQDFIRLLDDTGGVPRVVRFVLEGLTVLYDASRIPIARKLAQEYLDSKMQALPLNVVQALLPIVLTGQAVSISTVVADDSTTTFADLQHQGSLWLNLIDTRVAVNTYHVIIPMMALKSICNQHSLSQVAISRISYMLSLLDHRDWGHYEEFLACYHAFLNRTLARTRSSITLGEFCRGVAMHPSVAAIEVQLSASKDYEAMPRRACAGTEMHRFPLPSTLRQDPSCKEEAAQVASQLLQGKVVVNSHGAAVDLVQVDPLHEGGGVLVRALCVMHTVGDTPLYADKVNKDRTKAKLAVKQCLQLAELSQAGTSKSKRKSPKCVAVHITNGRVADDVARKPCGAIVIGRHNMDAFFGPVLSRGMWSCSQLHKNLHKDVPGQRGHKGFCTLTAIPAAKQWGSAPLRTAVGRLGLVVRMVRMILK